jgi:hypothetical protein
VVDVAALPNARTSQIVRLLADGAVPRRVRLVYERALDLLAGSRNNYRVHEVVVWAGHTEGEQGGRGVANRDVIIVDAAGGFQNIVLVQHEAGHYARAILEAHRPHHAVVQKALAALNQSLNNV